MSSRQQEMKLQSPDSTVTNTSEALTNSEKRGIMATKRADLSALLPATITLGMLQEGRTKQSVVVRVLRMWEAKNFKLNGTLLSLDMLLIDEKDTLIQGSIFYRRIHMFKDLLTEGKIYLINNFEIVPSYSQYKVTDSPYSLRFTDATQVIEVAEELACIKHEKFRIQTYAEFQSFAGTNIHLLDVIGQVLSINGSHLDDSTNKQKIVLLLLLEDNSTIRLTLWDDQASEFRRQYQKTNRKFIVVVCTCLNPKIFAGKLHMSSSGSTKIYLNHDFEVVREFTKRMSIDISDPSKKIVEEDTQDVELEEWTIQQVLDYVSSGTDKEKHVICCARIIEINSRSGWTFLSCSACSKKVIRSGTALKCTGCDATSAVGIAKFRVELVVECGERTTTFVMFDRDAKKIANSTAEDMVQTNENNGEAGSGYQVVPNCFLEMVGKTMIFQIKISTYNFETSVQTFTVIRIIPDAEFKAKKAMRIIKSEDGELQPTFLTSDTSEVQKEKETTGSENEQNETEDRETREKKKMRMS